MSPDYDTIAAPATAAGGAIAIVRISGRDALAVCDRIFRGRTPLSQAKGYTVHYGHIVAPTPNPSPNRLPDAILSSATLNSCTTSERSAPALNSSTAPDQHPSQLPDQLLSQFPDRHTLSAQSLTSAAALAHTQSAPSERPAALTPDTGLTSAPALNPCAASDAVPNTASDTAPNAVPDQILDDVLATVFRAPHSYTGEDSVEISCHGSTYIVTELLRLLTAAGARLAEPGEFTTRAFLAGKMDLSQAEAVADLIASSSRAAHALAATQMRGSYSNALGTLREKLLHLTALLELELDFSEEDVEFADRRELRATMQQIGLEIDSLRRTFSLGNAIKEGVAVAIVGAPNVGKSTLLNCLLGEDRAMVSDIAGTTRDAIEEIVNIDGVLFRFIDTAGIRATDDRLEQMGIARTLSSIARAQIVLCMHDAADIAAAPGALFEQPRNFTLAPGQTQLTLVNKIDNFPDLELPAGVIALSAKRGAGIDRLRQSLRASVDTAALFHGDAVVSNSRHYEALTAARISLDRALKGLGVPEPTPSNPTPTSTSGPDGPTLNARHSDAAIHPGSDMPTRTIHPTPDHTSPAIHPGSDPIHRPEVASHTPTDALPADLLSEEIRQVIHYLGTITGQIASDEILQHIFSKFCIGK